MPSTYSNLKIELMATGENNTTWGNITNLNLGTAIEEAIAGSVDVAFTGASVTLPWSDTNASQTARNMRLNLTGTASGVDLIVPAIEKAYLINNAATGTVTVKNATGTGIAVPTGKTMWVYNNGTNVVDAVTHLTSLSTAGNVAISGGLNIGASLHGNIGSDSNTIYVRGNNVALQNAAASTTYAYINSSGNFGINTAAPAKRLTVVSTAYASAEFSSAVTATPASVDAGEVFTLSGNSAVSGVTFSGADPRLLTFGVTPANNVYVRANEMDLIATGSLRLSTNTTERLRIGPAGQIGLGGANYGTSGQVLTSQGASSAPVWATPTAGTVTSVGGAGTVNGISLSGSVSTSGNLTLGGALTGVSLTTQVTGTLPIANGGTGSTATAYCGLTTNVTGTLPIANGGTNATTAGAALTNLGAYAASNPSGFTSNTGTVTSVATSGSTNGLSLTGGTITTSGTVTLSGSVTSVATGATIDGVTIGYRNIPRSTTSGTAVVGDVGKVIAVTAGITVPNSTFAAGDAISIYNDSAAAITITAGVGTLRLAGTTTTGNRTLAARGMATIWFNSATEAVISGAGVS